MTQDLFLQKKSILMQGYWGSCVFFRSSNLFMCSQRLLQKGCWCWVC